MTLLFAITIFTSAMLLFSVQPMVGKMILPLLGGTPAVWNLCMVFFQAALLAGYAYAHGSTRWLGVRRQAAVHFVVLLLPLALLPIRVGGGSAPPTEESPTLWLLWELTLYVGLPFFVVSTSAPLLQLWFSRTGHASAKDPYFLYAASNAGSLLALLAYPLLVEPALSLPDQTRFWAGGYYVLIVMALGCAAVMWRFRGGEAAESPGVESPLEVDGCEGGSLTSVVSAGRRLRWIALAFVPSSLMLGVTTHVTTDIAAVPLLWVVPLALYLLTFVIVFARRPIISSGRASQLMPYLFLPLVLLMYSDVREWSWLLVPAHMLAFFVASLVCHGQLAGDRPSTRHLTEFFLLMSIGGVLGGLFNAIIAPLVFDRIVEYPLVLMLACLMRIRGSDVADTARSRRLDIVLPMTMGAVLLAVACILHSLGAGEEWWAVKVLLFGVPAMLCFGFKERPIRFGLGFAGMLCALGVLDDLRAGELLYIQRNFFGLKRVMIDQELGVRKLVHGVTNHGMQAIDPERSMEPLAYYHRRGPLGDVVTTLISSRAEARVAVVGLGTGTLAAYVEPGQHYTFYEIDPAVARLAGDPRYFTFLERCRGTYDIVLGDGRLMISAAPNHGYGAIILDAFSSDAVPTHLITKDALELYLSKLEPDGIMVLNISNRYLSFEQMLANVAHDVGMVCAVRVNRRISPADRSAGVTPSRWMVMAHDREQIVELLARPGWRTVGPDPGTPIWTDQFCDIISLFKLSSGHEGP